ncbi:MAG: hypothetical protein CMJ75_10170 [Planctomycetaceae bacterium]|nr:hypothetical protein [Planctomycetaceae bacterium]
MKRAFLRSGRAAALVLLIFLCGSGFATGQPARPFTELAVEYEREVLPVLKQFCLKCHSGDAPQGDLDLQRFKTLREVRRGTGTWIQVVELLANGEMPPADAPQPAPRQRKVLQVWAEQYLRAEALASAGDPGPVVLRRLNNAEYTFTLRDLTGVALNPARAFPSEGAAGEGFTNTGNALVMSPGLLRKYLDAGKEIAAHAVLLPAGFRFSANTTRRDWTDECLSAIRGFYGEYSVVERLADHYGHGMSHLGKAGRLPLERYFAATLAERAALQSGDKTIADVAAQASLNAKYLGSLWSALTAADDGSFLLDQLRAHWRQAAPDAAAVLTRQVRNWQKGVWTFNPVGLLGRKGSRSRWMEAVSPLLTQHELQFPIPAPQEADKTNAFIVSLVAGDAGDGNEHDFVVWTQPRLVAEGKPDVLLRDWLTASGKAIAADSVCVQAPSVITVHVPAELTGRMLVTTATLAPKGASGSVQTEVVAGTPADPSGLRPSEVMVKLEHVNIGADKRTVSYRRPILVGAKSAARRRFATALEDFRKLFPAALCYTQIVPVDELLTLTLLYREDDHLARLMLDDAQTARLDALWEELRYVSHEPIRLVDVLDSLLETTIDHPQAGIFDDAVKSFNARADAFRKKLLASEVIHVDALVEFAARVWRRPLTTREETDLRNLYERLRQLSLSHEEAFRLSLARVFVASPFLYRLEVPPEGTDPAPVTDRELASRLSYFLWSSMPDETLRSVVDNGTLHTPAVLIGQAQRMLKDARVRRLATEFACHWLHIHDFDPLVQKSEKYFPEFAELRGAMYEESIRFLTDLFQTDGSLLSLLNADHTFLNGPLAEFYGVPGVTGATWRRIEGIQQVGRGGILGWATTLAKQSGATRTSPILRGNWISEVLLGEKLPKPPKNVPQLAAVIPPGLTERQLIQRHSRDAACAKCHARIDPFGFALEHFNGIGRWRDKDASGLAIDSQTTLPDGTQIDGLAGLRDYLLQQRRDDFLRQFCRKLLGYALGREIQLSDRPLVDAMLARLAASDYRFTAAVETIVLSQQFRMIRGKSLGD